MIKFTLGLVVLRIIVFGTLIIYGYIKDRRARAWRRAHKQKAHWPGVSILIPAYNEQENIRSTIESLICSTYPRKEIIVIDDGSTDKTSEVVRSTIECHPEEKIKLLTVTNGGKASALNHGINSCKFDVCVVVDADAVIDRHALYYFARHFADPEVAAVAGKVRTTGSNKLLDLFQTLEYAIGQNIDKRAFSVLNAVGVVPGPSGAWRRELLISTGGFATDTLVEDQDMTLRLIRLKKKVIYEPLAIAYTETPHTVKNFLKLRKV
jgi:cellulose synthase/poly-beta-1,6-N-acetylglucosamine synthase-like glycosyltransferase